MTEVNPFICYLPPKAEILIIGSFPCFNGLDYGDFFYSGSGKNYFWTLLSEITEMPAGNAREKKAICRHRRIALSDVALKIRRKKSNCSDSNLQILEYNYQGLHRCLAAGVSRIFFTGTFVQKHFNRIMPGLRLPAQLLVSPSPAANRHIGGLQEYKYLFNKKSVRNVYDYRMLKYREFLFS